MKKTVLFIAFFIVLATLISCNKEETPEKRFSEYIKLWNEQKFTEMYGYLSETAKKSVTKDEFVKRYKKVYADLEINQLDVQFKDKQEKKSDKKENVELPFNMKMNSIAGPIQFDHKAKMVKEKTKDDGKENWFLSWDTTYIFPDLEEGDKISLIVEQAKRGEILDRNGIGLAINGKVYEIGIVPQELGDDKQVVIAKVAELLQMSSEEIEKALNEKWVKPDYFIPIKKISSEDEELLKKLVNLSGVLKKDVESRVYPYKEITSHLIGYVGQITKEELEKQDSEGYGSNDLIGKRGLEQVFEKELKGQNGIKILIQKKDGTKKIIAEQQVENGANIQLTVDAKLQTDIYNEMFNEAGAAAAIHPQTGETLALVSSPGFDPNKLVLGMSAAQLQALEENEAEPLLNRFKLTYAPGSVIKPIVGAIGLTKNTINKDVVKKIEGLKWQKDTSWGNYFVKRVSDVKEPVNLERALILSDNIYFAQAGLDLGAKKFTEGLQGFGFEEKLEYEYPIEPSSIGTLDSEIKVADTAYGQGQMEMSVLHLVAAYTPFVNNGNIIKPILLSNSEKGQVWKANIISEENATIISNMLTKVIDDPMGTAHSGQIDGYSLAGKTGTAELKQKQGEAGSENGWFIAYNTDSPSLMIAMMIENVEKKGGSTIAVERIKNIFMKQK